jgi:hypothetical protein
VVRGEFEGWNFDTNFEFGRDEFSDGRVYNAGALQNDEGTRSCDAEVDILTRWRIGRI